VRTTQHGRIPTQAQGFGPLHRRSEHPERAIPFVSGPLHPRDLRTGSSKTAAMKRVNRIVLITNREAESPKVFSAATIVINTDTLQMKIGPGTFSKMKSIIK
jgi:hypothetical protein